MKELLFNLDTLQFVDVRSQSFAQLLVETKQIRPTGIVEKNGIKFVKYRFVNWKK